jgi:hypothetical protein
MLQYVREPFLGCSSSHLSQARCPEARFSSKVPSAFVLGESQARFLEEKREILLESPKPERVPLGVFKFLLKANRAWEFPPSRAAGSPNRPPRPGRRLLPLTGEIRLRVLMLRPRLSMLHHRSMLPGHL